MIPIKDDNKTKNKTFIRFFILGICTIVFFFQITSNETNFYNYYFGFKPASFFFYSDIPTFFPIFTIFTSMFMHGGWMHFLGNMLYLWIFADNVEDIMGYKQFTFFYLSSGVFASITQAIINVESNIPMIGASGAIAGVLGAYLFLFPKAKVLVLIPFFIFFTFKVKAYILLIFWFIYQFVNLGDSGSNVAWFAHIGGFLFGFLYCVLFLSKKKKSLPKKGKSIFLRKKGPWD